MADPNYIPYFSDIEDAFIRLREKSLYLSPTDWALMESWQTRGIPLHVVLRSIEEVFKNHKSAARRRGINSLRYCQSEVDAQFAEYCSRMVGKHPELGDGNQESASPFSKENVRVHLGAKRAELFKLTSVPNGLKIAILHVTEKLDALQTGLHIADRVDVQSAEFALTTLEAILDVAIEAVLTDEQTSEARGAVEAMLEQYKRNMPADVYERQFDILLKKRLRDIFNVPRLSLFHMK